MVITYTFVSLIIKGSFSNIHWDMLLVIFLTSFITLIVISDKEEKNKNNK